MESQPGARPLGLVARYATDDHYAALKEALGEIAGVLRAAGHRARVVADDNALGELPQKEVMRRWWRFMADVIAMQPCLAAMDE